MSINVWHENGNCPKREKNRNNWEKKEGQQKFLFFSSSMLRRGVDTDKTRFDCIPGAKIGHIANMIAHEEVAKYRRIVIHAGQNNVIASEEIENVHFEKQLSH